MSAAWAVKFHTLIDGPGSDGLIPEVHDKAAWRSGVANGCWASTATRLQPQPQYTATI